MTFDLCDLQDLQSELDALKKRCEKLEDYAHDAWHVIEACKNIMEYNNLEKYCIYTYTDAVNFLEREVP